MSAALSLGFSRRSSPVFDVYDEPVHCPAERCLTSWWYFGSLAVTPSVNDNVISNFISQKHKRRSRGEWATGSPKFDVEVTLYILSMTPESVLFVVCIVRTILCYDATTQVGDEHYQTGTQSGHGYSLHWLRTLRWINAIGQETFLTSMCHMNT